MRTATYGSIAAGLLALWTLPLCAEAPPELAKWLAPQPWNRDVDGPIVSLGAEGAFDDMHIFAPSVVQEDGRYLLWYCGSRGKRMERVFRLGLATSADGKQFEKYAQNPVMALVDGEHSILTPAILRDGRGNPLRENGELVMWFSSCAFAKSPLHTLHKTTSKDGIHWTEPSPALLQNVYCPTVLKTLDGYRMWYADVSKRPWVIRHASSTDGTAWTVTEKTVLGLSQDWEAEILVYPTVLEVDGVYLMWYGSYYSAVRRQTTAVGFAASTDGLTWHKHPQNPVLRPDPARVWESNYVGSGCVAQLADGTFRYWYASRTKPPFVNLYFAINTASWPGPAAADKGPPNALCMPPKKGDVGVISPLLGAGGQSETSVKVLEVVDEDDVIVRAWYMPADATSATFVDLWIHGVDTAGFAVDQPLVARQVFQVTGNQTLSTTCGGRSLPLLEPTDSEPAGKTAN